MLKKDITYENPFTNATVTETHYFHISKADLVQMEMEEHGDQYTDPESGEKLTGMRAKLKRIVDSKDGKAIMAEFREIIRRAYGKKEGERFLKSAEIADDFLAGEAYSELLFELCTNAEAAAAFISGVIPGNLEQVAKDVQAEADRLRTANAPESAAIAAVEAVHGPIEEPAGDPTGLTEPITPQVLTTAQASAMSAEELQSGLINGRYKLA